MKFFFKTMNIIYMGFIVSSLLIAGISIYLWNFELEIYTNLSIAKVLVIIIFVLLSVILSQYIYKKNLSRISSNDQLILKLQVYQTASIYRLSILEFTLIISALFFIFSKMWVILLLIFTLLILIFLSRPSKKSFLNLFQITEEELKSVE
ncbi:MAG: hypothetical protein HPY57_07800 [Ignavibacteria bacterium]|nr:hypothetical protein [Ignavibacteria bacterium]